MESKKEMILTSLGNDLQKENGEYYGQECQDKKINDKFRKLHKDIIDMIIKFCKENNLEIDEFFLNADGIKESIPFGEWTACTDSSFEMYKTKEKPYLLSI